VIACNLEQSFNKNKTDAKQRKLSYGQFLQVNNNDQLQEVLYEWVALPVAQPKLSKQ